jgi:hypothetical protein
VRWLNQYHIILEVEPQFQLSPLALNRIYIPSATGQEVPLGQLVKSVIRVAPLIVNHQGQFPSVTLSFNLKPGVALGQAVNAIARVKQQLHVPASLATSFQGNAQAFTSSLPSEPILIAATLHWRWADAVAVANIVHDAGRLPLSRPPRYQLAPLAPQRRCSVGNRWHRAVSVGGRPVRSGPAAFP